MPGMRPTMGGPGIQPPEPRGGSSLGMLMPMYTIAIIVFFVYTTFKVGWSWKTTFLDICDQVMSKKNEDDEEEEDEKLFADNIKYDEEYYNRYIRQYNKGGRYST